MAQRAVRMFPVLAGVSVVRAWSCLRILTPDIAPIYSQSDACPAPMWPSATAASPSVRCTPACWRAGSPTGPSRWRTSRSFMENDSRFRRLRRRMKSRDPAAGRRPVMARAGESVAAALLAAGVSTTRTTPVGGTPRSPFCLMGACFDCLMVIDGVPNGRPA